MSLTLLSQLDTTRSTESDTPTLESWFSQLWNLEPFTNLSEPQFQQQNGYCKDQMSHMCELPNQCLVPSNWGNALCLSVGLRRGKIWDGDLGPCGFVEGEVSGRRGSEIRQQEKLSRNLASAWSQGEPWSINCTTDLESTWNGSDDL